MTASTRPRGRPATIIKAQARLADLVRKPWRAGASIAEIHLLMVADRPGTSLDDVRTAVASLNREILVEDLGGGK